MSDIKICEKTIESIRISLFTNGSNSKLQLIEFCNIKTNYLVGSRCVSPVDFFEVITAVVNNNRLCDVIDGFGESWSARTLENLLIEAVESGGDL